MQPWIDWMTMAMHSDMAPMAATVIGGYVILQFVMKVVKFAIQTAIVCTVLAGGVPAIYHLLSIG